MGVGFRATGKHSENLSRSVHTAHVFGPFTTGWGVGFRIWGAGLKVQGLGYLVMGLGLRATGKCSENLFRSVHAVHVFGLFTGVWGLRFRIWGVRLMN